MPAFDDLRNPNRHPRRRRDDHNHHHYYYQYLPAPVPPPQQPVYINQLQVVVMPPAHQITPAERPPAPESAVEREWRKAEKQKMIDEYVRERSELINAAWNTAKNKAAKQRIIEQLRGVKTAYDKATRQTEPIRDSCQNPYNNMKRRLAKEQEVDPEMAEAVRLMSTDFQFTPDMAARIITAGWDPAKINLPLANEEARKIDTKSAAALRKTRKEFGVSTDITNDVEAAVSAWKELHGGPDGVDPDHELLYNRIDDMCRHVDNAMIGIDNVSRDIGQLRQDNHSIIDGLNILFRDAKAAIDKAVEVHQFSSRMIEKQEDMIGFVRDTLTDVRTVHKLVGVMAGNVDALTTNGGSLSTTVDALSTKVDSLQLAGDRDRLPPLVDSVTKTQGLVTSLHAEFSGKYVPDMNRLQAEVASLRQTVEMQGRLLQQLTGVGGSGGQSTAAAPTNNNINTSTGIPASSAAAPPSALETTAPTSSTPMSTSTTPAPQQMQQMQQLQQQQREMEQTRQQFQRQMEQMQQMQQMQQQPSTPAAGAGAAPQPTRVSSALASWQGSPSPFNAGFQSTITTAGGPPSTSPSVSGSPHHLSANYGGPPAPQMLQHQQRGGQPFVFGAGGGSLQNSHSPAPVDNNMWSPAPPAHNGQQYHHQGQPQQQNQQQFSPGVYPNGGGSHFFHHPQPR